MKPKRRNDFPQCSGEIVFDAFVAQKQGPNRIVCKEQTPLSILSCQLF